MCDLCNCWGYYVQRRGGELYFLVVSSFFLFLDSELYGSCRLSSGHFWCLLATSFMLWTLSLCTLFWRNHSTITGIPLHLFLTAALMLFLCLMRIARLSSASLFSVRLWCSLVGWYGHEVVDCVIHIGKTKSVVLRLHIIFSGDVIYNFPLQS